MAKSYISGAIPLLNDEEDIAEAFESIKASILWNKDLAERLREKVNYLESENYKDEELSKMRAELTKMQEDCLRGFPISEEELEKIKNWKEKHDKIEHNNSDGYHGTFDDGYYYEFHPTSLGVMGFCVCSSCKVNAIKIALNENSFISYSDYMRAHDGEFEFQEV